MYTFPPKILTCHPSLSRGLAPSHVALASFLDELCVVSFVYKQFYMVIMSGSIECYKLLSNGTKCNQRFFFDVKLNHTSGKILAGPPTSFTLVLIVRTKKFRKDILFELCDYCSKSK